MTPARRIARHGIVLPPAAAPGGNFVPWKLHGGLLYLSGQGPRDENGVRLPGRVPSEVSPQEARRRARLVGLQLLAVAQDALGSLDRVSQVVKIFGMVNADPDFGDHSAIIDGCSDLFFEVFGEPGRHARSAVGMGSLPHRITVEIEAILAVAD